MTKKIILTLLGVSILATARLNAQIQGIVQAETGEALLGAVVQLFPDSAVQVTDAAGRFSFDFATDQSQNYRLRVSFFSFETQDIAVTDFRPKKIILLSQTQNLTEIIVADKNATDRKTQSQTLINAEYLSRNTEGTLLKSIEKIAGISAINVGVGVAKPVIRGMSFNRVIVTENHIKQEGQQWGADHGLELDQFNVEQLEIIKGAAALEYGSDALGGVLNVLPPPIPKPNSRTAQVLLVGKSNNEHLGISAYFGMRQQRFFMTGRYSRQAFSDYRVPTDRFLYNGFELPILENRLKNTAGREQNFNFSAGFVGDRSVSRLTLSQYRLAAGLFAGAVGIPRSFALNLDGNFRNIAEPRQAVRHTKIIFNQDFKRENGDAVKLNFGYQHNLREEFSFPEFHSAAVVSPDDRLALGLSLHTFTANGKYLQQISSKWRLTHGFSAQQQRNTTKGFDYLLPNFNTFRTGIYSIAEHQRTEKWTLSGGLRLDFGGNESEPFQRLIYSSDGTVRDSLGAVATDAIFANYAASVGFRYEHSPSWRYQFQAGKSFRVPYPSETASNGVHHGTFRHEVGTPDLTSEKGYQFEAAVYGSSARWQGSVQTYFNYFQNYIYLSPTAKFSTLPEAGQLYQYVQNDAIYSGFEVDYGVQLHKNWRWEQALEYLWNVNLNTGRGLPFTPPPSVLSSLDFSFFTKNKKNKKKDGENATKTVLSFTHRYTLAQNRTDRNELPTPAYHRVDASLNTDFWIGRQPLSLSFQVQNLGNTAYLQHLSRYRILNIPEQGRNLVLTLRVNLF